MQTSIIGHVQVFDKNTKEKLLDDYNAVHPQNMAKVIARGLAHESNANIFKIALGNGGTYIDSSRNIVYNQTNIAGENADLYNKTYFEQVDAKVTGTPTGNSVSSTPAPVPDISSLVICTIQLSAAEPNQQALTDGETTNPDSLFTFDELGLKTEDDLLLSHIIFNPIEKNAQRELIISYTLTISVTGS